MLRLITKLEKIEDPKVGITISEVQLKESKLLSEGVKLGIIGQIDKLLSLASNDNKLIDQPYDTKPESIDVVIAELQRLRNIEGFTFSITKVAKESMAFTLLIEIVPISDPSVKL